VVSWGVNESLIDPHIGSNATLVMKILRTSTTSFNALLPLIFIGFEFSFTRCFDIPCFAVQSPHFDNVIRLGIVIGYNKWGK